MRAHRHLAATMLALATLAMAGSQIEAADPVISAREGWTRVTPPGATVGAGYLTLTSQSDADRLISAESPRAARVEIHEMSMAGGVMKMWQVKDGVPIAKGTSVRLAPGGKHLMFFEIERGFVLGEKIPVSLHFEKSGTVRVELVVEPLGSKGPSSRPAEASK